MTEPHDDLEPWRRIGHLLTERRTELGYLQRSAWARLIGRPGFGSRVITDLELGERGNYSDKTLEHADEAYQLAPGAIRRAIEQRTPKSLETLDSEARNGRASTVITPAGRVEGRKSTQGEGHEEDAVPTQRPVYGLNGSELTEITISHGGRRVVVGLDLKGLTDDDRQRQIADAVAFAVRQLSMGEQDT